MSTLEQFVAESTPASRAKTLRQSLFSRFLKLMCSVRLGVTLLSLLGLACFIGMLVMQQNVDGFDRYFAELTPSQKLVYGKLGLFNIYHAWYFNALLCLVAINIILASIDRFPRTWTYASKPNVTVPVRWLSEQKQSAEFVVNRPGETLAGHIAAAMRSAGWQRVVTSKKGARIYVFGQSGTWNRFGAYAVHVALLTILTGGLLTAQFGSTGQMPLAPGQTTNLMFETVVELDQTNEITKRLPFEVACTDIQQRLIKKEGSLSAQNTIDWMTRFTITDETGTHEAFVQMNRPFDYRGYRFFQASFTPIGRARSISVTASAASGGEPQQLTIARGGSAILADGTKIALREFRGNFRIGQEDREENTSDYQNPAAVLQVSAPGAASETAYAFGPQMANIPVSKNAVAGYTYQLTDFEKVADQHILSVQRDPGANVVYVGFTLLFLTLTAVFFFSHQRVWVVVEDVGSGEKKVTIGGNTNRNAQKFDEKFKRFVNRLTSRQI